MQASTAAGGLIARAANRHLGKSDREAAGVLSAAQRHTHFLDSPRMSAVLEKSDFTFADVKTRPTTVYLVLPPDRLATYARWLRLMLAQGLTDLARAPASPARPVLFLLDEFAALGHMESIEKAAGQIAGFGVKLWPVVQDLTQLKRDYREAWETFMGNAGILQFFGNNDLTLLTYSGVPPANMYATSGLRGEWTAKRQDDKTLIVTLTQSAERGTELTLVFDGPDAFMLTDAEADRFGPSRFRRVTEAVRQYGP